MKHYVNPSDATDIVAFEKAGYVELVSPLKPDGTPIKGHSNLDQLERDSDGNLYKFYNQDLTPDMDRVMQDLEQAHYDQVKKERQVTLDKTTVTITSGKVFDANEPSIARMTAASRAAEINGETQRVWRLADNTEVLVTITELNEALCLAIENLGNIIGVVQPT